MKPLFKFAAAAVVALCSINGYSQNKTYLSAGYDHVSYAISEGRISGSINSKLGLHAGLGMEFNLASNLYLDGQLNYLYANFEKDGLSVDAHSLYLPLRLKTKAPISENASLSFFAGPVASYGISGKLSFGGYKEDLYDSNLERFDVKAGIGCGIEFNDRFGINVSYDWGLLDLVDEDTSNKVNVLQAGIRLYF